MAIKSKTKRRLKAAAIAVAAVAAIAIAAGAVLTSGGQEGSDKAPNEEAGAEAVDSVSQTLSVGNGLKLVSGLPCATASEVGENSSDRSAWAVLSPEDADRLAGGIAYITTAERAAAGEPGWVVSFKESAAAQGDQARLSGDWPAASDVLLLDGTPLSTADKVCDLNEFADGFSDAGDSTSLTDEQKAAVEAYDSKKSAAAALLKANLWMRSSGSVSATFTESGYAVTTAKGTERGTYAISALLESGTITTEDSKYDRTTMSVIGNDGDHILIIDRGTGGGGAGTYLLTTDLLEGQQQTYVIGKAAGKVDLFNTDKLDEATGGHASDIESKITELCAKSYPTVSGATWDELTETDWDSGATTTTFKLNNSSSTKLYASVSKDGQVSVSTSSSSSTSATSK